MEKDNIKILVVDDEQDLCEILKFNLEAEGYNVDTALSAEEVLEINDKGRTLSDYNLFMLDVMMGEMSGFYLAKKLKENPDTANIPVIFLTALDTENDTITGFNVGADDYISKPFSIREVVLRVKAVLRRTKTVNPKEDTQNIISYKGLVMNLDNMTVKVDGISVPFTKTEFEILKLLLSMRGHVFSRSQLIENAWPNDVFVSDRTVDVNITRLRKKIGLYSKNIVTRLGFGYFFEEN